MVNASMDYFVILFMSICLVKTQASGVDLTRVYSAIAKGAVCLDGTAPAYQFDKGTGDGINNWLVYLQGGGWCRTLEECSSRQRDINGLGSSNKMKEISFSGILNNSYESNPNFHNWNKILVRYCDGSSFTGDVEEVDPKYKLYFRGARVFDAVMEDLLRKGMKNASNALLSGCSAGGFATILHCDKFRALLPTKARVKCMPDAGYVPHARDFFGGYYFENHDLDKVVKLHAWEKSLPRSCSSKLNPNLCFYPQNVVPHIQTPIFILNSVFDTWQLRNVFALTYLPQGHSWVKCQNNVSDCSSSQIKKLQGLRSEFLHTIQSKLGNHSTTGLFIDSCSTHCHSLFGPTWLGPDLKLNHKTVSEAVGDWFYERGVVQLIDHKNKLPVVC